MVRDTYLKMSQLLCEILFNFMELAGYHLGVTYDLTAI
jgi:hypothetical protein